MASRRAALLALLVGAGLALGPARAAAFTRSTTVAAPFAPLFWRHRSVILEPSYAPLPGVPMTAQHDALFNAMAAWNDAGSGCSDLQLLLGEETFETGTVRSTGGSDDHRRVVFRTESWVGDPCLGDRCQIALTTTRYHPRTGELRDADIDINAVEIRFSTTGEPGAMDLESAITHEVGHLIGLGHTPDPESTMFEALTTGETHFRSLAADDIDGLCFVYPAGLVTPDAPLTPTQGLRGGCAVSTSPASGAAWLVLAGLLLLLARRRAALSERG